MAGRALPEVVVPVAFLVPGAIPETVDLLHLAPPQEPAWWDGPAPVRAGEPVSAQHVSAPPAKRSPSRTRVSQPSGDSPTLFDVPVLDPVAVQARRASVADTGTLFAPLADAVLASQTYAAQKKLAGRGVPNDDQIRSLLTALLGAPGNRLGQAQFAAALRVPSTLFLGVVAQVQRVLNVEGYAVLARDSDGITVVLDEALLREQFGVG